MNNDKVGFFDWIVGYDDVEEYILESLSYAANSKSISSGALKILVVGCGTSTLSARC